MALPHTVSLIKNISIYDTNSICCTALRNTTASESSPTLHIFMFKKPFRSYIHHNKEEILLKCLFNETWTLKKKKKSSLLPVSVFGFVLNCLNVCLSTLKSMIVSLRPWGSERSWRVCRKGSWTRQRPRSRSLRRHTRAVGQPARCLHVQDQGPSGCRAGCVYGPGWPWEHGVTTAELRERQQLPEDLQIIDWLTRYTSSTIKAVALGHSLRRHFKHEGCTKLCIISVIFKGLWVATLVF